ncbi:MAG TPA: molybdopterin-dependent oxidoreductase [Anaerolineae bacterium]|nr:molybdopterin-dependent oxidoreductase [Anaerolineae bacterium]
MPKRLSRRQFLQVGALTTAAWAVSGCTVNLQRREYLESYVRPPEEGLPGQNLWYASTCRECQGGCGIIVRVSEGRARKIEGNPDHPVNRGKLCARGQAILQELYDPDRLPGAVRQVERGTQEFEPLYWEIALSELVAQLRDTDPGGIAFLGGSLSTHLWNVVNRFSQALSTRPPVIYGLGQSLSGQQALSQSSAQLFGSPDVPFYDIANAEIVYSFGANFLETWVSPVLYSRAYGEKRRGNLGQRGLLAQFESRLSSTAASADEWVTVRPGTEGLAALGLGRLLVDGGLLAVGEEFAGLYEAVNMDQVVEVTGVRIETLLRLARIFASVPDVLAIPGSTLAAQEGGAEAMAAVQSLNLLAGRLGQPGGVYLPPVPPGDAFAPAPLSTYADLEALIADMAAGRVQVLMVHGTNPVFELPPGSGFVEALQNVRLVVSFSPTVDETAAVADLILPDHTTLEGWGYHVPVVADRTAVSSQQPIMRPLYQTRATVDVFLAVAAELGGELGQALPWANEVDFLTETLAELGDGAATPEAFWANWRRQGGYWTDAPELRAPVLPGALAAPLQVSLPDAVEEDFPFSLHLYPSVTLFDGRGANKSWLQEAPDPMTTLMWQTWIEIHPDEARELGLEDGDVVRVISPTGEVEALVYRFPALARGVVAMPIGRGHEHYGRFARNMGTNPLLLLAPAGNESGALTWASTRVRLEPAGRRQDLSRFESPVGVEYLLEEH